MNTDDFAALVASHLPFAPNAQQRLVLEALARFCAPTAPDDSVFLLNGYAGTGKTSLCAALVRALADVGTGSVLMAPTGRAAKVFSGYAKRQAYTIHRLIYRHPGIGATDFGARDTRENTCRDTLFIVDEASMITADDSAGGNLLEDLIHYVYTGPGCRLILLGDTAQLPPVGCVTSPAMSPDVLRGYGLRVSRVTLTDIARQGAESGILRNATWLRRAMRVDPLPEPYLTEAPDVVFTSAEDAVEDLYTAYADDGVDETVVITRSNMRALGFNREIRASVLYLEEEISKGELLIVAKNNYYWSTAKSQEQAGAPAHSHTAQPPGKSESSFIANGDVLEVQQIYGTEMKYGCRFADVRVSSVASGHQFQTKVLLDSLQTESANVPREKINALYYAIMEDPDLFGPYTPADARLRALRTNPYWNALHVKYAYAVTCHKAQGGQWRNVFVDMSYIPAEAMGIDFYRWLYTAVTRATKRLYLIR